jgi:hypothetical protein
MDHLLSNADIYAMFERAGVTPIERDQEGLRDLMSHNHNSDDRVVYRTVLSNGTGKSLQGGRDAKLESDSY